MSFAKKIRMPIYVFLFLGIFFFRGALCSFLISEVGQKRSLAPPSGALPRHVELLLEGDGVSNGRSNSQVWP